jgi:pilus assembly protein Flp/PilA
MLKWRKRRSRALIRQEVKINMIKQFFQEEEGQTLVEYGLLISLVALVVIAVLTLLGRRISNTFNAASNQIGTATS